ncbi:MAG: SAM-dependent methyltransferase [Acidobacteriota bacterium]
MPQTPQLPTPNAMEGCGAYNRSSRVQAAGLSPALPMLQRAAQTAALPADTQPVVLADYGSSQGRNSLAPMNAAIDALRQRIGPDRPISVIHTDLPQNDFSALFHTLNNDPNSYLQTQSAVFASAVGRSYFQQILPPASVTLGWSSWAVQWLSRVPGIIPDQVQISFSHDPAARAAFSAQAAEDWQTFLKRRACELMPGGKLVVLTMSVDDDGNFGYAPLVRAIYATLLDLVQSGLVTSDEARHMAIPTVARSRADFLAPFERNGRFAGLLVEELETFDGEDGIWLDYQQHKDATQFAAQWAAFSRASVYPTLAGNLESGGASRVVDFCDRLEAGTAARLAAAPERMSIPLVKILLARQP